MSSVHRLKTKIFAALMLVVLGVNFFVAGVARAGDTEVGNVGPMPEVSKDVGKEVKQNIGGTLVLTLFKVLQYALDKVAYDAAEYLATGDKAKGPLFWTDPGKYFTDVGDQALGEGIVSLSDNIDFFKKYKINLCIPPDPKFQLWLKFSLAQQVSPPYSRCKLSEAIKTYQNKYSSLDALRNVGIGMAPGNNELAITAGVYDAIIQKSTADKEKAKTDAELKGAPKAAEGPVKGDAVADKEAARQAKLSAEERKAETKAKNLQSIQDTFMKGDWGWGTVGAMALYVGEEARDMFLNAAASKLLAKYSAGGFFNVPGTVSLVEKMLQENNLLAEEAQSTPPRPIASAAFEGYQTVKLTTTDNYNYVAEMADCSGRQSALSCTIDPGLQAALSQATLGQSLTIREAMDKGMLHKDWLLKDKNADQCASAYCYNNLVKLRFWRIFPVGMEIAADLPGVTDKTLENVVKGFNIVGNPFYHLVDPDWIIKAPLTRCGALGYGTFIEKDTNIRQQYCAQPQHCVNEDDDGNCIGEANWGYCLREKNIWRLGADKCDAQFNTCTLYASASGSRASYLDNTISRGVCNAENAGCRAYSVAKTVAGAWDVSVSTPPQHYFNRKAEKCDAGNEGCSKFLDLAGKEINLKKAPTYAGCYGEKAGGWPQNKADLYKLDTGLTAAQKQECGRFAAVCSKEEAGCESYQQVNSARAPIPGTLSATDRCDAECVGYAKYMEQKLALFSGESAAYFIAGTAKSCPAEAVGCEAFINLDTAAAGGEIKEHYTELRACSKNESEGDTFYTWEGSDTAGYQLKSYQLKKDTAGSPFSTLTGAALDAVCNSTRYAARATNANFNADCREFYNRSGAKSYRLYSRTVTISPTECQRMRAADISQSVCARAGGEWSSNLGCVYLAIPSQGKSCSAEFSGCRAYSGNTGNNFQSFWTQNFQSGRPGQVLGTNQYSAEALEVNGVSLRVSSQYIIATSTVAKKSAFNVTFWAKGSGNTVSISVYPSQASGAVLSGAATVVQTQSSNLYSDWRPYTVGPFVTEWDSSVLTGFKVESNSAFFVDNIVIEKMTDNVYVIKESWKTPTACDAPVAQYQLGCQAYTDSQKTAAYAKSFTSTCRPEAVGCQKLIDVKNVEGNTTTASPRYYNALCEIAANGVNQTNSSVACKDDGNQELCLILPGKPSCRFNNVGSLPAAASGFVTRIDVVNTLTITAASEVYLVNNEKARCDAENQGCRALGLVEYDENNDATATKTVYLKDQPDKYSTILCQPEAERCETFVSSQGGTAYFVDPALRSGNLCEWNSTLGGWVKKGTTVACHDGSDYGIRPTGRADYSGKVGLCPEKQDGCSEFVDPMSTDQQNNRVGVPYFVINNDKLDRSSCNGQVSKSKGCVLFNETSRGVNLWNAAVTYDKSVAAAYNLVAPENCGVNGEKNAAPCLADNSDKNNANVVLKVERDRVCSEWLACKSYSGPVWDQASGKTVRYCNAVVRCDKPSEASADGGNACGSSSMGTGLYNHFYNNATYQGTLTMAQYQKRPLGWEGQDFSGFTIPGQYSPEDLTWINITGGSEDDEANLRLVRKIPTQTTPTLDFTCSGENTTCGVGGLYSDGICKGGICMQTPYGTKNFDAWSKDNPSPQATACRTYPEMFSPFPNKTSIVDEATLYNKVNFCQQSGTAGKDNRLRTGDDMTSANACDCNYTKRAFGGVDKYLNYEAPAEIKGVCVGGRYDGRECSASTGLPGGSKLTPCGDGGSCLENYKETKFLGWKGVCLQYDFSKKFFGGEDKPYNYPCLIWMPVDKLQGTVDATQAQSHTAGFSALGAKYTAGPYYCLADERWEYRDKYLYFSNSIPRGGGQEDFSSWGNWDCDGIGTTSADPLVINGKDEAGSKLDGLLMGRLARYFSAGNDFIFQKCAESNPNASNVGTCPGTCPVGTSWLDSIRNTRGVSQYCSPGYFASTMERLERVNKDGDEDTFYLKFYCAPEPTGQAGWFRDAYSNSQERFLISYGKYYSEIPENRCLKLVSVGNSRDENKALTDAVWKAQKSSATKCSAAPEAAPSGALTINTTLPNGTTSAVLGSACAPGSPPTDNLHSAGTFSGGQKKTLAQVQALFAKSYGVFQSQSPAGYSLASDAATYSWDETATGQPPVIISLGAAGAGGNFKEGRLNAFTIDSQDSGDVKRNSGTYVSLRFFYHANPNQMPVKEVRAQFDVPMICSGSSCSIDRNAGATIGESGTGDGWFMNYRGLSATGEKQCVTEETAFQSGNFGLIEGRTCFNGYFDTRYMFSCAPNIHGWNSSCPDTSVTGGCCVFKPRVQVRDNWGWCNGTCSNGANGGCYDDPSNISRKDCSSPLSPANPWLEYPDRIIVVPQ